jgi:hypothetical protein
MTDHKSQKEWIDAIRSCGQSLSWMIHHFQRIIQVEGERK